MKSSCCATKMKPRTVMGLPSWVLARVSAGWKWGLTLRLLDYAKFVMKHICGGMIATAVVQDAYRSIMHQRSARSANSGITVPLQADVGTPLRRETATGGVEPPPFFFQCNLKIHTTSCARTFRLRGDPEQFTARRIAALSRLINAHCPCKNKLRV
jgi:hypothetical protein